MNFGSELTFEFGISTSMIPCVPISVKTDKFEFFGLNLGKLPNYVKFFVSNKVEVDAESLVEARIYFVKVYGAE